MKSDSLKGGRSEGRRKVDLERIRSYQSIEPNSLGKTGRKGNSTGTFFAQGGH